MSVSAHSSRRGVLLLLVLGMLAMFGLIAVTFVIISRAHYRSSQALRHIDQYRDDPRALLEEAFAQVVRGSNNNMSAIGPHGLLEDLYGNDTRITRILSFVPTGAASTPTICPSTGTGTTGQLIQITLDFTYDPSGPSSTSTPPLPTPSYFPAPAPGMSPTPPAGSTVNVMHPKKAPEECVGSVITFLKGRTAGISARLLACTQTSATSGTFLISASRELRYFDLLQDFTEGNVYCLINGTPFSGTGRGFDPTSPRGLNAKYTYLGTSYPWALLPNPIGFPRKTGDTGYVATYPDPAGPGGANKDYTAPDYQTMILGLMRPRLQQTVNSPFDAVPVPIPSLHRADLVNYWQQKTPNYSTSPVRRMVELRPLPGDNVDPLTSKQNFTGSNPNFVATWDGRLPANGQWDVDNAGTGVPDSIWVDLGVPARAAPDGRMYKPLFAILCIDLDGRLNLNAHGNLAQTLTGIGASRYYSSSTQATTTFQPSSNSVPTMAGTATGLPLGQGYGPAEINLAPLFTSSGAQPDSNNIVKQLLTGNTTASPPVEGRYGELGGAGATTPVPGHGTMQPLVQNRYFNKAVSGGPTAGNFMNRWAYYNGHAIPASMCASAFDVFGSPMDFFGTGAVALDAAGWPLYGSPVGGASGSGYGIQALLGAYPQNAPYELNLNPNMAWRHVTNGLGGTPPLSIDNPFTPAEFERLLRPFDVDSNALPPRLLQLTTPSTGGAGASTNVDGSRSLLLPANNTTFADCRMAATTESWDLPCPPLAIPYDSVPSSAPATAPFLPASHFVDLLRATYNIPQTTFITTVLPNWKRYISWELQQGLKMDLNRPFGTGLADSASGITPAASVVDSPSAASGGNWLNKIIAGTGSTLLTQACNATNLPKSLGNPPTVPADTAPAAADYQSVRQNYARDLYLLAMLLTSPKFGTDTQSTFLYNRYPNLQSTAANNERRARALAQWAVNVVDFRDRDSIMTGFAYDPQPFGTPTSPTFQWRLPANGIAALSSPLSNSDGSKCVVWGCEAPSLLISETIALHDRRTQPTKYQTDPSDTKYYQLMRPVGSLFVELYNPSSPSDAPAPELENLDNSGATATGQWSVDLNMCSPSGKTPVWRMIIVGLKQGTGVVPPVASAATTPFDPDAYQTLPPPTGPAYVIERSVYFAQLNAASAPGDDITAIRYYANCPGSVPGLVSNQYPKLVPPGHYAVIGPGAGTPAPKVATAQASSTTYIGMNASNYSSTAAIGDPSNNTRRIVLNPSPAGAGVSQVQVFTNGTTDDVSPMINNSIQPPVALVIDGVTPPAGFTGSPPQFSVTEPGTGAGYKTTQNPTVAVNLQTYPSPGLTPSADQTANATAWSSYLKKTNVYWHYRMLYLQRLANPLVPWNATTNPYRTVDSMQIDLYNFNGCYNYAAPPADANDPVSNLANIKQIFTRERGLFSTHYASSPVLNNIWPSEPETTGLAGPNGCSFPPLFQNAQPANGNLLANTFFGHSFGFLNKIFSITPSRSPLGGPPAPFPWLTWNNRPFNSQLELLMVPMLSPSQLLRQLPGQPLGYGLVPANSANPYITGTAFVPFPHLANFFGSVPDSTTTPTTPAAQLFRLLDYVHVPSKFAGTAIQGDPTAFTYSTTNAAPHPFHPPFNWISTYREPGRINLNTLCSPAVWQGLMNYYPNPGVPTAAPYQWQAFLQSRQGYPSSGFAPELAFSNNPATPLPTRFANPFRSAAGGWLVPPVGNTNTGLQTLIGSEVNATLLRNDPTTGRTLYPLLQLDATSPQAMNYQVGTLSSPTCPMNTERNPYFRYQGLQRLGNLVTTRSNVFAVWVTVGYFEVRAGRITAVGNNTQMGQTGAGYHPDGYYLGQEMGYDTGEIKRHRAFFLFDRTIPMGFVRGQDLNYEKGVLLKRFIE